MIISDDQAWNDYSFMGHEHIKTPHLDKLAKRAYSLEEAMYRQHCVDLH